MPNERQLLEQLKFINKEHSIYKLLQNEIKKGDYHIARLVDLWYGDLFPDEAFEEEL